MPGRIPGNDEKFPDHSNACPERARRFPALQGLAQQGAEATQWVRMLIYCAGLGDTVDASGASSAYSDAHYAVSDVSKLE